MTDDLELIEDCEARESRLGDWERNFIESVRLRLESGQTLTEGQRDKLNQIWDRVTEKG